MKYLLISAISALIFLFSIIYAQSSYHASNVIHLQCGVASRYCAQGGWLFGPTKRAYLQCVKDPRAKLFHRVDSIEKGIFWLLCSCQSSAVSKPSGANCEINAHAWHIQSCEVDKKGGGFNCFMNPAQ